jgi:FtsZ-binding cell division protein ZapB
MPAKTQKKSSPVANSDEEEPSMLDLIKDMSNQLRGLTSKIDNIESEFKGLKVMLTDLKNENKQLKADARENERRIAELSDHNNKLEDRLNSLEQHHRGWSARILNIPLPEGETDNDTVRDTVYSLALLPILQGAVSKKLLREVPSAEQLLEVCHVLPGKPGYPRPIIMRFYNRNVRDIIFRMKKFFAPREGADGAGSGAARGGPGSAGNTGVAGAGASGAGAAGGGDPGGFEGRGRYAYPLYEDLTRAAFLKLRAISQDSRVKSCWSTKGQIKFILHSNVKEIKKVSSLLEPLDTILK